MPLPNCNRLGALVLAGALSLSAAACASVEPPRAYAQSSLPAAVPAPVGVRANAPVPNPPERLDRAPERSATVQRAIGGYRVGKPYQIAGVWYVPAEQPDYDAVGTASWYGDAFQGRPTANGEVFDMHASSAAHATLPLPSVVEVTNLDNDRSIQVRVNDRGPFKPGRIIDLSREAADRLGFRTQGTARVRVRYVGRAPLDPNEPLPSAGPEVMLASASARPKARKPDPAPAARPVLVAAEPVQAPAPSPALVRVASKTVVPADLAPTFAVQAGSFANKGNAERAAKTLGAIAPAQVRETEREGTVLYRVLVGAWPGRDAATDALGAVADAGFPDARVVSAS